MPLAEKGALGFLPAVLAAAFLAVMLLRGSRPPEGVSGAPNATKNLFRLKRDRKIQMSNFVRWVAKNDKFIVAASTLMMTIFTGILVICNIYLYNSSEKSATAAKTSADAALIQASVVRANLSLDINVHPFNKDNIDIETSSSKDIAFWTLTAVFKNVGGTDARDAKGAARIDMVSIDKPISLDTIPTIPCPNDAPTFDNNTISTIVTPGSSYSLMSSVMTINQARAASGQNARIAILFEGYIEYKDIFPGNQYHHYMWCDLLCPNNVEKSEFSFINKRRFAD